jgi:hypothetical protein
MRQFGGFVASKEYYMDLPYKISWIPDWSDWREHRIAHLTAYIEEIPEVRVVADDASEAVDMLHEAFALWLEEAELEGRAIPKPNITA